MLTPESVQACLEAQAWTFARSMPWVPHWYVLRERWASDVPFDAVVIYIREHGRPMVWGKKGAKPYLNLHGWRYWTMGSPVPETTVINRERVEKSKAVPYEGQPDPVR